MICARCEALQTELNATREVLAAWEERGAQDAADARCADRLGRWQAVLGLSASEARVLLALVDRPGVTVAAERLAAAMRHPRRRAEAVASNVIEVMIYRVRKALKAARLACSIETIRGVGYVVEPPAATAIKTALGEA